MKCNEAKILLSAELDGELSPSEELALTGHLAKCAACAQEKASLSSLRGTMSLWADEEPSEWLAQSFSYKLKDLMGECKAEAPKTAPRRRWGILGPATAGLLTALFLVIVLLHNQPQPTTGHPGVGPKAPVVASTHPTKASHSIPHSAPIVATLPHTASGAIKRGPARATIHHGVRIAWHAAPRYRTHETIIAVKPTPAADIAPTVQPNSMPDATDAGIAAPPAAITIVGRMKPSGEDKLKDNIGEAGLAMNENVEKLRGKLQEAVDLLVSKPPMPVKTSTNSDGGSKP